MPKNILPKTLIAILLATTCTYMVATFFKYLKIVVPVGSVDAWIGFSGSILGSSITMLALYFTLKQNEEINRQNQMHLVRPYISCSIINLDPEEHEIVMKNYIDNYDFIECKMRNISNNIANGIKIRDEYATVIDSRGNCIRYDDLYDKFGISMYTVSLNDGTFLAPQEEYKWRTNFGVDKSKDGIYKWGGSAFAFKYTIIFELSDIHDSMKYAHKFEYEININVDVNNKLHFFLWNISNSVENIQ